MRLTFVDKCKYCKADRLSQEDCAKHFGHSHATLVCSSCCCYGGDFVEGEEKNDTH